MGVDDMIKGVNTINQKHVVTTDKENNNTIIFLDRTLHRKDDNFEFCSYENVKQLPPQIQFIIIHDTGYKIIGLFFFTNRMESSLI
jgi:hypothetical protein